MATSDQSQRTQCHLLIRAFLIAAAFVWTFVAGFPSSAQAQACPAYELVGASGSGQRPSGSPPTMGSEVKQLYSDLNDKFAASSLGSGALSSYAVDYPAVGVVSPTGVGAFLHLGGAYTASVRMGTKDAIKHIKSQHAICGSQKFILAGYSQGAQALGDALQSDSTVQGLVVAAAFFGDPYFNADSWSGRGRPNFDPTFYGAFGPRSEWPESLHGAIFSYCHFREPICNLSNRYHILGDGDVYVRNFRDIRTNSHLTPAYCVDSGTKDGTTSDQCSTGGDTGQAAKEIARVIGLSSPPPPAYAGPLDIVFSIDSTGSMGDAIGQVQQNVASLVRNIRAVDSDFRVALVDYKDAGDPYQSRVDAGFTTDIDAFTTALNGLSADGGGDTPESVYSGIMTGLNLPWRNGAKKLVIQIGDAAAKDPEPVTGFTLAAVRARALAVDPAIVDTIQPGTDSDAESSLKAISDATSGHFLQLPDRSDLSGLIPAITNDVENSTTAPTAAISAPNTAIVGSPTNFSAGASTDDAEPIVKYDWDFNNDGVYDLTTADPVATHTYDAPYAGSVVVRVVAQSGSNSLATARISVVSPIARPPLTPTGLAVTPGDGAATLTWSEPPGGDLARWFTFYDGEGSVLGRIAANPDGSAPSPLQDGELTNGQTYAYSVSAGSERGESSRDGPVSGVPRAAVLPAPGSGMGTNPTTPGSGIGANPFLMTDTTAPGVSKYSVINNPFAVGKSTPLFGSAAAKTTKTHKKGTTFRYTLSEAATVRIVVAQGLGGRRKGAQCVAPTRKLASAIKCILLTRRGTLTRTSHKNVNRVAFSGRIGSKALKPGKYQATLTATDKAKNVSKPKTVVFMVVRR